MFFQLIFTVGTTWDRKAHGDSHGDCPGCLSSAPVDDAGSLVGTPFLRRAGQKRLFTMRAVHRLAPIGQWTDRIHCPREPSTSSWRKCSQASVFRLNWPPLGTIIIYFFVFSSSHHWKKWLRKRVATQGRARPRTTKSASRSRTWSSTCLLWRYMQSAGYLSTCLM